MTPGPAPAESVVEPEEIMVDEDGLVLSPSCIEGTDSDTSAAVFDLASPMPSDPEAAIRLRRRDLRREVFPRFRAVGSHCC